MNGRPTSKITGLIRRVLDPKLVSLFALDIHPAFGTVQSTKSDVTLVRDNWILYGIVQYGYREISNSERSHVGGAHT